MQDNFRNQINSLRRSLIVFGLLLVMVIAGILFLKSNPDILHPKREYEKVSEGKTQTIELDVETIRQSGFVDDEGVSQVIQNCTQCHSAQLVTQNRLSKKGWEATIIWMQETQNLWDLGANQEKIVGYLAKNYGPKHKGRRQNLTIEEWYKLE